MNPRRFLTGLAAASCAVASACIPAAAQQLMNGPVPGPGRPGAPNASPEMLFSPVASGQIALSAYLVIWLLPIAGAVALLIAIWLDRDARAPRTLPVPR